MDERKVAADGKGGEEAIDERAVEGVAVEPEDLERAAGRGRGEEREQGLLRGGGQAQNGERELAEVWCTEVGEEDGEEGVPQLCVTGEIEHAEVGLVEGCCELCYDPWVRLDESPAKEGGCGASMRIGCRIGCVRIYLEPVLRWVV
jgi:hypothetical protein